MDEFSPNTKITVSLLILILPAFAWAVNLNARVNTLEEERHEIRRELKEITNKLDDIRARIPLVRPDVR